MRTMADCTPTERRLRLACAAASDTPLTQAERTAVLSKLLDLLWEPTEADTPCRWGTVDAWVALMYPGER